MANSQRSESSLTSEEITDIINDTVLYILSNENSFSLIKRQDVIKNILKERKRHFVDVMKGVKTRLLEDFGLELIEIEQNKQYALVNQLSKNFNSFSKEVEADRILIIIVLALIFMNNGVMSEEAMLNILKRLGIKNERGKKHEFFGDVENALRKKFVRWTFLESNVIPGTDPPLYEFRWGKRAEKQVSKKQILEFACQILGDTVPENWGRQYAEAEEQQLH